jgi:hypothetical protein
LEDARAAAAVDVPSGLARLAVERIGGAVRERVQAVRRAWWEPPAPEPAARALLARLDSFARSAARRRDPTALALAQRAIAFAARGHTAGETRQVERLARLNEAELSAAITGLPPPVPAPSAVQARITGVILFLGTATFPRCRVSAPSCSTSTAR